VLDYNQLAYGIMSYEFELLAEQIAHRRLIVVAGAGVAKQTTAEAPTWPALLRSGTSFAAELMERNAGEWREAIERLIDLGVGDPPHTGSLLLAAEGIQREIRSATGPARDYRDWLSRCFAGLRPEDPSVVELLCDLSPSLIATTNYDDLIEQVVGWASYSLRTAEHLPEIQRVLRGERPAVLHLHGHYRAADSVVLGIRDYDEILEDAFARTLLRTLLLTRTLLFVGFGAGLDDPNFGNLLRWSEDVLAESELKNFCLIRRGEQPMLGDRPLRRVQFVEYGDDYCELKPFLIELRNAAKVKEPKVVLQITGSEIVRPGDEIFVPDYSVSRELADAVQRRVPLIVLQGALGSGRSQIARWLARSCQSEEDSFAGLFDDVLWLPARALWWNLAPEAPRDFRGHNVLDYFALLAERLDRKSEASLSINEQVTRSIKYLTDRRYLVILEGVEHVLEADGRLPDDFASLLRTPGRNSCIVITSERVPEFADLTPESHPDQLAVIPVGDRATAQIKGYLEQFRHSHPDDTGERAKAIEDVVAVEGCAPPLVVVQWACGCPQAGEAVRKVLRRARTPHALATQKNLFNRLVLDHLEECERVVLFSLALFAPPPTAVSATLQDLERVTGYPAAEVGRALQTLSGRLLISRDERYGYYLHALTVKWVLSSRTLPARRALELENNFVRWAVALSKEHNEWEMNSILTHSLLRHLDNLRVAYEVAMVLRPRHLRVEDRELYVLGRTVGQALYMDGRWELGSFILQSLHDQLPDGSALQLLVRLLLARHRALQDEQELLEQAESLCQSVLDQVERLPARKPADQAEKREIRAEALMRLADARGRRPEAGPEQLTAARQDLQAAIAEGKFGIRVNARNVLAAIWLRMGEEPQLRKQSSAKACFVQALEVLEDEQNRLDRSAWNRIKAQAARIRADAFLGLGLQDKARRACQEAHANSRNVVDERLRGSLKLTDARLASDPNLAREAADIFRQLRMHREEHRAHRFRAEIERSRPKAADDAA